jgi:pyruvate,orthophosphate dikinase
MQIVRIGDGERKLHSDEAIGAKAANLAGMAALGLPVPPAFVFPVGLCAAIAARDGEAERVLHDGLKEGVAFLEGVTGKRLGDRRCPLLLSVRSGAARSMPGMLDTVLDVGCTPATVRGLVRLTGNPRFAWDCRRRFLEGYAETVLGLDPAPFAARLADIVASEGGENDRDLDSEALERIAALYQALIEEGDGGPPDDPMEQLVAAARASPGIAGDAFSKVTPRPFSASIRRRSPRALPTSSPARAARMIAISTARRSSASPRSIWP